MSKPLRVLIVDDSEDDALLMIHALKQGGDQPAYQRVEEADSLRRAIEKGSWDLILCDYQMPHFNGIDAIKVLKETGIDIPLIIVSGAIGEETAAACMRLGARDYIMKGNLTRLAFAVERELEEAESRRQSARAQEALRMSEERFRALVESSSDQIFMLDLQGTYLLSNDRVTPFGLESAERLIGRRLEEVYPPDVFEIYRAKLEAVWATGKALTFEHVMPEKDGLRYHRDTLFPIYQENKIFAVGGICRDITDRKRLDDEMLTSKNRFEAFIAQSSESIWCFEFEEPVPVTLPAEAQIDHLYRYGVVTEANDAAAIARGFSRADELIGTRFGSFFPRLSRENVAYLHQFVSSDYRITDAESKQVDVNGNVRFFINSLIGTVINGSMVRIWGVKRDVTKKKQAEIILAETLDSLRRAVNTTIQVLVSAVETRDPYTAGHQIRSSNLARAIASELGLPQEKIEGIRLAGSIHDIGKLSIPAEILSKPIQLSEIEFSLIKTHAQSGFEMLKDVESPWPLAEIVYQHHERMDGSGYPRNLKGEEILMEARILAVADVVEAMASHRPYRPGLGIDAALNEIEKNSGLFYDSAVVDACLQLFREKGFQLAPA